MESSPESGRIEESETTAPRTPTEKQVAQVFAEVLRIASPGLHDNFFRLGGHSLKAVQVVASRKIFTLRSPWRRCSTRQGGGELAAVLGRQIADLVAEGKARIGPAGDPDSPSIDERIPRLATSTPAPHSFQQQQLYFIDLLDSGNAYNMSASLRLSGLLDRHALSLSLNEIVRRHESLRHHVPHAK